jgi:hypothetical protein
MKSQMMFTRTFSVSSLITLLGLLLLLNSETSAQTIKLVKGRKVLIELQGSAAEINQEFFSVDASGKKKSLLKIVQVKNGKAVANILKGKPLAGQNLQPRGGSKSSAATSESSPSSEKGASSSGPAPRSKIESWGILGSYGLNKMTATKTSNAINYVASMTGAGFGILGFYDYPMSENFVLRGMTGVEQFVVNGDVTAAVCNSSLACEVNIMYLSFYGAAKYHLTTGKMRFWMAGGIGYLFAASKSSNILKTDGLSSYAIVPSIGLDMTVGKTGFVPIAIDYAIYPDTGTVTGTSTTSIRIGWGFFF